METGGQTATAYKLSNAVAKEIRVLLVRRDMKQTDLATLMGVSEMWVSRRLRGAQVIDLNDLQQFADALSVEAGSLLPRADEARADEGRVLATTSSHPTTPNAGSGRIAVRRRRRRAARIPCPIGGPRQDQAAPTSPVLPTQRRPMLLAGPGQRISA